MAPLGFFAACNGGARMIVPVPAIGVNRMPANRQEALGFKD